MGHPEQLVELYRTFYRADKDYQPSARKCIQPLYEANEIICRSDSATRTPDALIDVIAGRIGKLMQQIHVSTALGRWVLQGTQERQAILEFATYLVNEVFYGSFNGDLGRFAGRQRGYIEDACEFIYRRMQDAENVQKTTKAQ
jgi:CRISPR-associated protein Csc3